jgi:ribonuclease HI
MPKVPIVVYTDGACSGNPGPAGAGVVVMQGDQVVHEISMSLGHGTNNIAELTAVKLALEYLLKEGHSDTPVTLYTDSNYCVGLLTKDWKAKANVQLVAELRELTAKFRGLSIRYIKGHDGHHGNERADELAVAGCR